MVKRIYICSIILILALVLTYFEVINSSVDGRKCCPVEINRHITFRIDDGFSTSERKEIESALNRWEKDTDGYVKFSWYVKHIPLSDVFHWQEDKVITIYKASSYWSWERHIAHYVTRSFDLLGVTMRRVNDIFIVDEIPDGVLWRFELVVAHEVGHVLLGPFHSKSQESLMYPFIGSDFIHRKITQEEISLLKQRIRR